MSADPKRLRAAQMLVLANACWALSFPIMKALNFLQAPLLPGSSSWFIASMTISIRSGLAAVILLLFCARSLRQLTRLEQEPGVTVAEVVLNWTIQRPGITVALCGAKRPEQIRENAAS